MILPDKDTMLLYGLLILGIAFVLYATAGINVGKTRDNLGRAIYRAKNPRLFWEQIFLYYSLGIFGIGVFLYERLICT